MKPRIIAIGDDVCDKYLSRGMMYPGGQCVNTCAYAVMNGANAAFLGKFGNDEVAQCIQKALDDLHVDISHCRHFVGENGFACVTLMGSDRVFIGSNKGGISKEHPYDFTESDWKYIKGFDLIYTNLNANIEADMPTIASLGVPIAFDFSNRWTDEYLALICPYIQIAILSCAHLSNEARIREMKKVQALGVPIALGTIGENGSWLVYKDRFYYECAVAAQNVKDTMGAGDSYFATFLVHILKNSGLSKDTDETAIVGILTQAMKEGAKFSAKTCCTEGAFGYGIPITGRIIDNRRKKEKEEHIMLPKPIRYEYSGEGIKCAYRNNKWVVCIKNWKPNNDIDGLEHLEIHHTTDEQFILISGKCIIITADRKSGKFETELTPVEAGVLYTVPAECWFFTIMQKETKMMYVQDSGCSTENSEYCDLTVDEIESIRKRARPMLAD